MNRVILKVCVVLSLLVALPLGEGTVYAQSSGNFSYGNTGTTHCVLNNDGTGRITGGDICHQQTGPSCTTSVDCNSLQTTCWNPTGATGAGQCLNDSSGGSCTADANCTVPGQSCIFPVGGGTTGICGVVQKGEGTCNGSLKAGIKTSGGSGNIFLIRPSAVIGLLTDVTVGRNGSINIGTSSALAGVDFTVDVKSLSGQPQANVIPNYPITYASRFVQISTNLFNVLGNLCTLVTPDGSTNLVGGVTTAAGCYISFNESTVSAHSFDWIAGAPNKDGGGTLSSGNYGVTVSWSSSLGNFGISRSLTCVGPVNLTVQQNKVFSFNTPNTF